MVKGPAQTALLELTTLGGGQMASGLILEGAAQVDGYEDSAVPKRARGSEAGVLGLRQPQLGIAFPLESD